MKRILIFYSHFTPAYRAGGPIQSIRNMVQVLKGFFKIDIVCSATDLGETKILDGITPDKWNNFATGTDVFYIHKSGIRGVAEAIKERSPDVIYLNGVFLPLYSWLPLLIARFRNIPVVCSPRGMLQAGALAGKSTRKQIALQLIKGLKLHRRVLWHATDEQEEHDIRARFGSSSNVRIVGNVPAKPNSEISPVQKETGVLRLIFLSVIAAKKNLDLVLKILSDIQEDVSLDIYGPVKDQAYWEKCLLLMRGERHSISYIGPLPPSKVRETLGRYHALILLTKGENFGHAIYESLSVGRPAVISQYTPWGILQDYSAGITVDIRNETACRNAVLEFLSLDQTQFNQLSTGAFQLASKYYHDNDFKTMYVDMFSEAASKAPEIAGVA